MLLEAYFAQLDGILQKLSDVCICSLLPFQYLNYVKFLTTLCILIALVSYMLLLNQCGGQNEKDILLIMIKV